MQTKSNPRANVCVVSLFKRRRFVLFGVVCLRAMRVSRTRARAREEELREMREKMDKSKKKKKKGSGACQHLHFL